MTPAFKTSGILLAAAALSAAALLLTQGASSAQQAESDHALSLHAKLASSHVLLGSTSSFAALTIRAPATSPLKRPRLDLAIVFDRSGSMEGQKLIQAKQAAEQLIASLLPSDRFSLTVYGTEVEVLSEAGPATKGAKAAAYAAIARTYTDGGTNLSGGLLAGKSQFQELRHAPSTVRRIVLISDGKANEGIVSSAELARLASETSAMGISITTVGIGLEFDERTMTQIAVSGRGNYYFAESADMLAELFKSEIHRLSATVATRIRLTIAPQEGVEVEEIIGYPMLWTTQGWSIDVADMHAGETRKVIVALRSRSQVAGIKNFLNVSMAYLRTEDSQTENTDVRLAARMTEDFSLVQEHRDPTTNRLIERARTGQVIEEATSLYEQGRRQAAQQLMQERSRTVQTVALSMDDTEFQAEMKETEQAINGAFSDAPPSSPSGKRSRKAGRKKAYELKY